MLNMTRKTAALSEHDVRFSWIGVNIGVQKDQHAMVVGVGRRVGEWVAALCCTNQLDVVEMKDTLRRTGGVLQVDASDHGGVAQIDHHIGVGVRTGERRRCRTEAGKQDSDKHPSGKQCVHLGFLAVNPNRASSRKPIALPGLTPMSAHATRSTQHAARLPSTSAPGDAPRRSGIVQSS